MTSDAATTDIKMGDAEASTSSTVLAPASNSTPTPMFHSRVHIQAGDLVILFMGRDAMAAITVTPGAVFHNKYGKYKHDDMIGVKFGSKMHSPPPQSGYLHLLRPTPELWTLSLPHRTQILYLPDIAYILMRLNVRVGGTVVEAGTGSGSMTHSLARAVGPRGIVHSFEYHLQRYETARKEFEDHGLQNVALRHRNVCKDGFEGAENVEAVFLDLPAPWEAIPHAAKTLRTDMNTRICCFSPCLEQVLKTVATLRAEGFADIYTQEVLARSYDLVLPTSQYYPSLRTVAAVTGQLREHEGRKEERRRLQMKRARERREAKAAEAEVEAGTTTGSGVGAGPDAGPEAADGAAGGGADDAAPVAGESKRPAQSEAAEDEPAAKRARVETDADAFVRAPDAAAGLSALADVVAPAPAAPENGDMGAASASGPAPAAAPTAEPPHAYAQTLVRPALEMRGHTSYLTFAVLHPLVVREALAAQAGGRNRRLAALLKEAGARRAPSAGSAGDAAGGRGSRETTGTEAEAEGSEYGDEAMDKVIGSLGDDQLRALSEAA
ncbi:tRNA (adenine-N(1)-)-methyltransferase catalytic subunit trm61 [Cryptotrichosporon argae]